jgi:cysteine desulfurase family protein
VEIGEERNDRKDLEYHSMRTTEEPRRIYFDNAATSFPKPPSVHEAMIHYATSIGASPGRGGYAETREAERLVRRARERVNQLINGESAQHVVWALNASDALNMAIKGVVRQRLKTHGAAHIVTTEMEHNSVLRPLNGLREEGATVTRIAANPSTGIVNADDVIGAIQKDTCLVAVTHCSNVSGSLQPVEAIGAACRERGVLFLVDAAQSLGHIPVDVQQMNIDLLAFPGHKGLLGPSGTGGLYIRPGVESQLATYREGGTGSKSEHDVQPDTMPDKFEPGSHNAIGIIGLSEGVQFVIERGVEKLRAHELPLIQKILDAFTGDNAPQELRLLGPTKAEERTGVFSFVHQTIAPLCFAELLEHQFGILSRAGLHCAPLAHATFGTAPPQGQGAVRLSFGPFTTEQDVNDAILALQQICREAPREEESYVYDPVDDCCVGARGGLLDSLI